MSETYDRNQEMDITIIVAAHKPYWMPADSVYLPVQVGAEGKKPLGFQPDNAGENISARNSHYCELTGLYWAWKNLETDYLGLVHYRRHFSNGKRTGIKTDRIADRKTMEQKLAESPILLPKPRHYRIETTYSQYAHAHHAIDLDTTREIISEKCPKYLLAFDTVMARTSGHRFNMFVMRRDLLNQYCEWLFPILFELENRLDISEYSTNDARVFGFVGERLLDVWLDKTGQAYTDVPYVFLEKQNWLGKGFRFLKRKFVSHKDGEN